MSDHINAKKGDIAERILLPGDPLRAKYIAETYLENPVCFNEVRGMYGYTGTYKGVPVSVMGTGMGVPSIHIYARELMTEYDVQTLIRIGTAGSYEPDLNVGELVISQGCCYTSSFMDYANLQGTFSAVADYELVHKASVIAKEMGVPARVGLTVCNDLLYFDNKPEIAKQWNKYGVVASEQEAVALYALGSQFRRKTLTIMNIVMNIFNPDRVPLSQEAREKELDDMIKLALETAIRE
ncbi:MAG: purine-nucleoside phosphorylase [Oscillospiraceae bacterium]|nr:purine-nucleoside phosphorylase [Oscillospiraceae bacterium]